MILDERTEFADATPLALSAGVVNIGDQIPLSVARNISAPGNVPLYLVIQVTTAITGGGTGVTFQLVSDSVNPPAVDGSATVHWASKSIPAANLLKDTVVAVVPIPGEPPAYETILGLQVNGQAAPAGGAINAFLTPNPKQWKAYPDAL